MRVLVTGSTGFVGRHVLPALVSAGVEIHCVTRQSNIGRRDCVWHQADLLQAGAARNLLAKVQPERVLHLAWCAETGRFWTDPSNLDWISATLALAQAAADLRVQRFVAAGTCYEYDWPARGNCHEDRTPLAGHCLYDVAKDSCRRVLLQYFALHGINFSWARLFYMYGPHEAPARLVASLARSLLKGEKALCSPGRAVRDFMDVRDAGAALAALTLADLGGPINIASGEPIAIADLAISLGRLAGQPELVVLGALPARQDEPPRIVADVSRMRHQLAFRSVRTLEQGLTEALEFWSVQHELAADFKAS